MTQREDITRLLENLKTPSLDDLEELLTFVFLAKDAPDGSIGPVAQHLLEGIVLDLNKVRTQILAFRRSHAPGRNSQ